MQRAHAFSRECMVCYRWRAHSLPVVIFLSFPLSVRPGAFVAVSSHRFSFSRSVCLSAILRRLSWSLVLRVRSITLRFCLSLRPARPSLSLSLSYFPSILIAVQLAADVACAGSFLCSRVLPAKVAFSLHALAAPLYTLWSTEASGRTFFRCRTRFLEASI